ncbi:MAG TPA: diguanylate cyclase [Solirubrobacterales bacterium]|nr:diguanylate cyclase [Solirubrobacterales bacterium]
MSGQANGEGGSEGGAGRLAREVAALHETLLGRLREEVGDDAERFAEAAQRLAGEFGDVTAVAVEAARRRAAEAAPIAAPKRDEHVPAEPTEGHHELASLYRPGQMRRRLDQLIETNRRYGHPFGLAVFDASGPGTRNGDAGGGRETVMAILGAALRDSIRLVDEAFHLEEDAICVLAPNLRTVEGMQMAERLLGRLDELERAGGLRIAVAAGVAACPEHGADAEQLLHRADEAMWRARAVGQPVGVGALQDR